MKKLIRNKKQFRNDIKNNVRYIEMLRNKDIDYWNYNSFLDTKNKYIHCFSCLDTKKIKLFFNDCTLVDKYKSFLLYARY